MLPYTHGSWQLFLIEHVQGPLVKIFELVASTMPKPTKENTYGHNIHNLIDLRDWHLSHEAENSPRRKTYEGMWNYTIVKCNFDNFHADRLYAILKKAREMEWEYRAGKHPDDWWEE